MRGSISTIVLQATRLVGNIVLLRILIESMGAEKYGLIALGVTVIAYSMIIESAITPVLKNQLTISDEKKSRHAISRLQSTAATAIVLFLCSSLFFLGAILVSKIFSFGAKIELPFVFACMSAISISSAAGIAEAVFASIRKLGLLRYFETIGLVIGFFTAYIVSSNQENLEWIFLALVSFGAIMKIIVWQYFASRSRLMFAFRVKLIKNFIYRNKKPSFEFLVLQVVLCILSTLPALVVARAYGLEILTLWTTTQRLASVPGTFYTLLLTLLWPHLTRLQANGDVLQTKKIFFSGIVVTLLGFLSWVILLVLLGDIFFNWLTGGIINSDQELLCIWGLHVMSMSLSAFGSTFLNARGNFKKQLFYAAANLLALIFGIMLTVNYGYVAIAFIMLASGLVLNTFPLLTQASIIAKQRIP